MVGFLISQYILISASMAVTSLRIGLFPVILINILHSCFRFLGLLHLNSCHFKEYPPPLCLFCTFVIDNSTQPFVTDNAIEANLHNSSFTSFTPPDRNMEMTLFYLS